MGIQNWSETVVLVDLPKEPEMVKELKALTEKMKVDKDCNVVIDFSNVDIMTSSSLLKLRDLRNLIGGNRHRLVLCSVAPATKSIFGIVGLDMFFEIADDKFVALAGMQMISEP